MNKIYYLSFLLLLLTVTAIALSKFLMLRESNFMEKYGLKVEMACEPLVKLPNKLLAKLGNETLVSPFSGLKPQLQ